MVFLCSEKEVEQDITFFLDSKIKQNSLLDLQSFSFKILFQYFLLLMEELRVMMLHIVSFLNIYNCSKALLKHAHILKL